MNRVKKYLIFFMGCLCTLFGMAKTVNTSYVRQIKISGYVGKRIDDCIKYRVKAQDVNELIEPFRHQNESHLWQSEFWGKWVQGAIASYRYNRDSELYRMIKDAEEKLMHTQLPNGYIGNYAPKCQLQGWDIWGRKYTCLGLLKWYDLSGDKKALRSACRLINHLMTQVGLEKVDIALTGNYKGMASCSILEPVMYLYNRTQNNRYLEFAEYIVKEWEENGGPRLISKSDVPVFERFSIYGAKDWYSAINGQKAYEMMSCYVGLLELYKTTGNPTYLSTVEKAAGHIEEEEINIAGSGSAFECWYNGRKLQTRPTYHSMETCVTFTWMQLCERLLEVTGNPMYADYLERTIYNALMSSMKSDASMIAKYTPLEGFRHGGEMQCGMSINCCMANGPRGFAMIPRFVYRTSGKRIDVNFYVPSEAEVLLDGKSSITLKQKTNYPVGDRVEMEIDPEKEVKCTIALRIPLWSKVTEISVNGEKEDKVREGSYYSITRKWKKGDKIDVQFDLRTRLVRMNGMQALLHGPVVLARDSRFKDGYVDESSVIVEKDGYVDARPVVAPENIWMCFTVPMILGTDLENFSAPRMIRFCDFSSVGDTWNMTERYRVWLPQTLDIKKSPK